MHHRQNTRRPFLKRATWTAAAATLFAGAPHSPAVDGIWYGASGSTWFDPQNWIGGVPKDPGDTATFSINESQTISVDGPVSLARLHLQTEHARGYTLNGTNVLTVSNIQAASGSHTLSLPVAFTDAAVASVAFINQAQYLTLAGPVSASGPLTLGGGGAKHITGDATAVSGPLLVTAGTLRLYSSLPAVQSIAVNRGASFRVIANAADDPARDRVSDTAPITLRSATLAFDALRPGASETLGPTTLAAGRNTFTSSWDYRFAPAVVTLASLTRLPGATFEIAPRNGPDNVDGTLFIQSPPALVNGILGGWATAPGPMFFDFLTYDPTAGVRTLGAAGRPGDIGVAAPHDNVLLNSLSTPSPLTANATINSLNSRNSTFGDRLVDLGGHTFNLVSGGLLGSGDSPTRIINGTLTAGGTAPNAELFVRVAEVAANIADNPGGALSVVIGSAGTRLSGNNTYSGKTFVNDTVLTVASQNALSPNSDIEMRGGGLRFAVQPPSPVTPKSLTVYAGTITRDGGLQPSIDARSYVIESATFDFVPLAGDGPITKTTPGTLTIRGSNPDYSGDIDIFDGTLLSSYYQDPDNFRPPLGTGDIRIHGGTLVHRAGRMGNPIILNGGAVSAGSSVSFDGGHNPSGLFTGPVDVLADSAVVTMPATPSGQPVTFAGPLTFAAGRTLTKTGALPLIVSGPVVAPQGATISIDSGPAEFRTAGDPSLRVRGRADALISIHGPAEFHSLDLAGVVLATLASAQTLGVRELRLADDARFDVAAGALVVDYPAAAPSPIGDVRQWIASDALMSSADTPATAVGYAEASDVLNFSNGAASFAGRTVDDTAVLVRLTLLGDADLDRSVDFDDLAKLAQNYNNLDGNRLWHHGDFTYDGNVNFDDLAAMAQNYNTALPTTPIPGATPAFETDLARALAQVPEPSTALLTLFAGALTIQRRRRPHTLSLRERAG